MTISIERYPIHATDKLRYADTDRQGHVNNACFATFLETGRVEFLYNPSHPLADADAEFVIARLQLDYRGEIHWPGNVTVGTGVLRIGTSSLTLTQAIFQDGRLVAESESVIVHVDTTTRKAKPLSAQARERLATLTLS
jgi:acyl-CoA thioester hydrolase